LVHRTRKEKTWKPGLPTDSSQEATVSAIGLLIWIFSARFFISDFVFRSDPTETTAQKVSKRTHKKRLQMEEQRKLEKDNAQRFTELNAKSVDKQAEVRRHKLNLAVYFNIGLTFFRFFPVFPEVICLRVGR
jgi:hypothetical protein